MRRRFRPVWVDALKGYGKADFFSDVSAGFTPGGDRASPGENVRQVQACLAAAEGRWALKDELRLSPDRDASNGFYGARLRKVRGSSLVGAAGPSRPALPPRRHGGSGWIGRAG